MREFFEQIREKNRNQDLYAAWILEGAGSGAKALFMEEKGGRLLTFRDASFPEEMIPRLDFPEQSGYALSTVDGQRVFLERIPGKKKLVICGAGHVSMPVIRIGRMLDYEVTVIEDRSEFAGRAKDAGADRVIEESFEKALEELEDRPWTAYIVVTRGHRHDVECLRRILKKNFAYAGMMGSRNRAGMIREQLLEEGFPAEKVNRIHMPVGLPICSRTPEEISVSILAEVIRDLNQGMPEEGFPETMAEELCALHKGIPAAEDCGDGKPAGILAMIVEKHGEAPRQPGTRMLIRRDGSFLGSVGGGSAEAEILKTGREMLQEGSRECRLVKVSMKKGIMQCGGEIRVFLLPVGPDGT